eukprot:5940807-Pyramimonas_sp.AAC.1
MMRMGKQDQSQHHQDWALYVDPDNGEHDEYHEIWYEAYDLNDYEWGWAEDEGWSATIDGEWYYMVDDDAWLQYDHDGECIEELTIEDYATYYGGGKGRGRGKGQGGGKGFRRNSKGKGKSKGKRKGKKFTPNYGGK